MLTRKISLTLALLSSVSMSVSADVQWAPFLNAEIYGGYSKFAGDNVSGPNGSLLFVPGVRLGEKTSLLPTISYAYQKTRDVKELAGGGFLTQQSQDMSGSLKGIYAVTSKWRAKAYASYRQELLKETSDEKWGSGLFDNDKMAGGIEAERVGERLRSVRFGADYYQTKFKNFESLSSSQFGAEINSGKDVLDFNAIDATAGMDLSMGPKALLSGYLLESNRNFPDQKIVKLDGTYSNDLRKDMYLYASLGYRRQLPTMAMFNMGIESLAGVDATYLWQDSNQNNYDASQTKFNRNYYDYSQVGLGPMMNFRFKEKLTLGLSYLYEMRSYADRPSQNADGTYKSKTISTNTSTFRVSTGYPIVKGLSAQVQFALQHATSNMDYETVYRYNYSSSSIFGGLSYQF